MFFIELRNGKQVTWFIGTSYCDILDDHCSVCLLSCLYCDGKLIAWIIGTSYCVILDDHCSVCLSSR